MVIFGVITNKDKSVIKYMFDVNNRLHAENLLLNPFRGGTKSYGLTNEQLTIINIEPIYPNLTFIGWIYCVSVLFFGISLYWLIPGIIISLLGLFWSKYFFYLILLFGLRKETYKGKIKMVNSNSILGAIIKWHK